MLTIKVDLKVKNNTEYRAFDSQWFRSKVEEVIKNLCKNRLDYLLVTVTDESDDFAYKAEERRRLVTNLDRRISDKEFDKNKKT